MKTRVPLLFCIAGATAFSGCAAAVLAGAGGAGAVAYTDRGAKGEVEGDIDQVKKQAEATFQEMGIQSTHATSEPGKKQELDGKSPSRGDISVSITPGASGTSHVEVIARQSALKWNKDYAKELLSKIASKS